MVHKWKQEFFDNAYLAFGADTERKAARIAGEPIPEVPEYDPKD